MRRITLLLEATLCSAIVAAGSATLLAEEPLDFAFDIRPILSDNCFQCHGPDEEERAADLRLDNEAGIRHAFAAGNLKESLAWQRLSHEDPDMRMPPREAARQPSREERELIRRWIEAGAPWSEHWAFGSIERPPVPEVEGVQHPVDRFVARRLRKEGLSPAPQADRETLIRRLSFDLIGLPPSLDEVDRFVEDRSPQAWEQLIDRLFESPHYGERMALEWLDGARYADTNGYQNDFNRNMWPWRDWVIDAYNKNMPFDQFVVEQLAGDLLPEPTLKQRIATGFNRNNRTVTEAGSIPAEWLVENVVDRVETTSTVFLGLTMGCARCHTHKFDPITHREFYEFYAFFHNVNEKGVYQEVRGNVPPLVSVPTAEQAERKQHLEQELAASEAKLKEAVERSENDAKKWLAGLEKADLPDEPSSPILVPLDGRATALVSASVEVAGKQLGSPAVVTDDLPNRAVKLAGKESIEFDELVQPSATDPFTLSVWVKRNSHGAICSKMSGKDSYRGCDVLVEGSGKVAIHMIDRWPDNALKIVTRQPLSDKQWAHLTITYDGSSKAAGLRVFFSGIEQPFDVHVDKLSGSVATSAPFRIGARDHSDSLRGSLSLMRMWGKVISADEIAGMLRADVARFFAQREQPATDAQREQLAKLAAVALQDESTKEMLQTRSERDTLQASLEALNKEIPTTMVMEELPEPRDTYVLKRGEYDKPIKDDEISADVPGFLPPLPKQDKPDRLALARWLVAKENPLTARVAVNRLWKQLFGRGLVQTVENFGVQSEPPSHPQLLDWLASELMDSGWDIQHILRTIATSDTYRQAYYASEKLDTLDPDNRLLARGPRHRLSAEQIRDNALAVSGLLSDEIGGPPVFPYQPDGLWDELAGGANGGPYKQSTGDDLYRRSLYTFRKRTVSHPTTATFDAPSFEYCTVNRATTNTPLQALAMLNDTTYTEAARCLGGRMMREGGQDAADRIAYGFRLVTARQPNRAEVAVLIRSFEKYREQFATDRKAAERILSAGQAPQIEIGSLEEQAAYATIGGILLNLDETITKE